METIRTSDALFRPIVFENPDRLVSPNAWVGHIPFAFWIIEVHRPKIFVELGTHSGVSYSAFAQAIQRLKIPCNCFAVDTWKGDEHAGFYNEDVFQELSRYHDSHFSSFSRLVRSTFDQAIEHFDDQSIDLLHIDGLHSYEAVKHDFESWLPKMSDRGVVLFHDTNVRENKFGVWKFWIEISEQYPHFNFINSHGLGVLGVGKKFSPELNWLFKLNKKIEDDDTVSFVRSYFERLGSSLIDRLEVKELSTRLATLQSEYDDRSRIISLNQQEMDRLRRDIVEKNLDISSHREIEKNHSQDIAENERKIGSLRDAINLLHKIIFEKESEIASSRETINHLTQKITEIIRQSESQRKAENILRRKIVEKDQELDAQTVIEKHLYRQIINQQAAEKALRASLSWSISAPFRFAARVFRWLFWKAHYTSLGNILRLKWIMLRASSFKSQIDLKTEVQRANALINSGLFDIDWYLEQYPDVRQLRIDPVLHYLHLGKEEDRNPGPFFNTQDYLSRNPDVASVDINPLLHYVLYGQSEGRKVSASDEGKKDFDSLKNTKVDLSYKRWIELYDSPNSENVQKIKEHIKILREQPLISIIVPVYNTPELYLREMIESVITQIYPHWELCIADDASSHLYVRAVLNEYSKKDSRIKVRFRETNGNIAVASNSALELATGSYIALLDHDDLIAPHALYTMVAAINKHPKAEVFYSDEDKLDVDGNRFDPYFKPDWNEELLYAQNYINHFGMYRTAVVRALGGFRTGFEGSQDYDLLLRVIASTHGEIVHIPHILYHWRLFRGAETFSSTQADRAATAARAAIREALTKSGEQVNVVAGVGGYHRVIRAVPAEWPLVTAIIPTRDHVDVLQACILGLLEETDYANLEIIIADNDSEDPATLDFLQTVEKRSNVRVIPAPGSFNYSRINNKAAKEARGEILLFLNNDTSVIHRSWLKEMVVFALRNDVGIVGARLLYPDNTIQHAGVVLGIGGVAGHVHLGASREDGGYFGRLMLTQDTSCVTGACMVTRKEIFESIGGFDEENLPVAFNDVDFCLRTREAGYRIIWTPFAELYHWESKSRGSDMEPGKHDRIQRETRYMRSRWAKQLASDPFFNPNLSLSSNTPALAFPPRIDPPWTAV